MCATALHRGLKNSENKKKLMNLRYALQLRDPGALPASCLFEGAELCHVRVLFSFLSSVVPQYLFLSRPFLHSTTFSSTFVHSHLYA